MLGHAEAGGADQCQIPVVSYCLSYSAPTYSRSLPAGAGVAGEWLRVGARRPMGSLNAIIWSTARLDGTWLSCASVRMSERRTHATGLQHALRERAHELVDGEVRQAQLLELRALLP